MQNRNSDLAEPVMAGYIFFRLTCVTITYLVEYQPSISLIVIRTFLYEISLAK